MLAACPGSGGWGLFADALRLDPVVHEGFLEPRVFQRLFGRDALFGVVDEDPSEEVEELSVERGAGIDEFLFVSCVQYEGKTRT